MKRPHQNDCLTIIELRNKAFFCSDTYLTARLDNGFSVVITANKERDTRTISLTICATIEFKSHRDMRTPATGVDFYESRVQWWIKGMCSKAILVEVSSKSLRYNDIKEKNQ